MTPCLTASDHETHAQKNGGWGAKNRVGVFLRFDYGTRRNFGPQVVEVALGNSGCDYETASGQPLFINRDPLEERGAWNLYSGLNQEADDPYAGASGVQGTSWQTEWEQAQDRLLQNTSLPHTTQKVTFDGKRNSGLPGASERNQKTYSANATGHYAQGGAPGTGPQAPIMSVGNPAEGNADINLYIYAANNPINSFDALGLANFVLNGRIIGNDGQENEDMCVIKTTETSFRNGTQTIKSAGITKDEQNATVDFIKKNTGDPAAFQNNDIAYKNSVTLPSEGNRQAMANEVAKDNGKGGTDNANNREYGGSIQDGKVVAATPGDVATPSFNGRASIDLPPDAHESFHSHPSGTSTEEIPSESGRRTLTIDSFFYQPPSAEDIKAAGQTKSARSGTHYVFGRSDKKVYIYNSKGVEAVMTLKDFLKPRR